MTLARSIKDDVQEASERHGWECEQIESNVWRFRRGSMTLDVSYTMGGHFAVYAIHVQGPREDWWLGNKQPHKRKRLLEMLREGER